MDSLTQEEREMENNFVTTDWDLIKCFESLRDENGDVTLSLSQQDQILLAIGLFYRKRGNSKNPYLCAS